MVMAPVITELLPGATRFSSIFVFPIEVCVWGGGALLIRGAVRKWDLGWVSMLTLAIALAIAEECLIQQTSLAPLVIRIKGVTYARSVDVNYVYMLWALIYEPVFVVFLPVYLTEIIFSNRKGETWLSKTGAVITIIFFLLGALLAWFTWTQIARTKIFRVPVYHPPVTTIIIAIAAIIALIFLAFGPLKKKLSLTASGKKPSRFVLYATGILWAVILYGIVLLAFGLAPYIWPIVPIAVGIFLILTALTFVPKWVSSVLWLEGDVFALVFAIMIGAMAAGYIGFIGALPSDLYFKIGTNAIAIVLMFRLGIIINRRRRNMAASNNV